MAGLTDQDIFVDQALRPDDPDLFRSEAVADRVAELAVLTDTPVRIALFGPWGSGKSSVYELLRRRLDPRKDVALVRYDAGSLSANALRRNLISNIAEQLGVPSDGKTDEHRRFHDRLYQKRRTVEFDFASSRDEIGDAVGWLASAFVGLVVILSVLIGTLSVLTDLNFGEQVADGLPRLVGPTGIVALAVGFGRFVLDGARVESEDAQPSEDEEFARRLRELVELVRKRDDVDRIVIFVDELDRSEPREIIEALAGLRSFLSTEHCAWIVAADRAALERALRARPPGATPADPAAPYYSTAGAYLDKVFSHQVSLPPLRPSSLLGYALEQAEQHKGLWAELRDGSRPDLADVLYALVPSHVRSPRRVKVLLNAYAIAARVAEARGLTWRTRADELAKLVALQVEFPGLAVDLIHDPRLPTLLLDPPSSPSAQLDALLQRHRLGLEPETARSQPEGAGDPDGPGAGASDVVDVPTAAEDRRVDPSPMLIEEPVLRRAGEVELRRFLVRTFSVPNPGLDLLHLEEAGSNLGLADRDLAAVLEIEARDDPETARAAVVSSAPDQHEPAVRLLAAFSHQASGQERRNLITAMLGVYADLHATGGKPGPLAQREAANAVVAAEQAVGLLNEQLSTALVVHLDADPLDDASVDALIARPELLDGERLREVAAHSQRLPAKAAETLTAAIVTRFTESPDEAWNAVAMLADDKAAALIDETFRGLEKAQRPTHEVALLNALSEHETRPGTAAESLWWLLEFVAYPALRGDGLDALSVLRPSSYRRMLALRMLAKAPATDWETLGGVFGDRPAEGDWKSLGERALTAVEAVISGTISGDKEAAQRVHALAETLAGATTSASEVQRSAFAQRIGASLSSSSWWASAGSGDATVAAFRALRAISDGDPALATHVAPVLLAEVERVQPASLDEEALRRVPPLAACLTQDDGRTVAARLAAVASLPALRANVAVLTAIGAPQDVDDAVLNQLVTDGTSASQRVLAAWIEAGPAVSRVREVIGEVAADATNRMQSALSSYVDRFLDHDERTELLPWALDLDNPPVWVAGLRSAGIDEHRLVSEVDKRIRTAGRAPQRKKLVECLGDQPLAEQAARRAVPDLILYLAGSGKAADFEMSWRLARVLGGDHQAKKRLAESFDAAAAAGTKLPLMARPFLESAGIAPLKRSFEEPRGKGLRGFLKRR